MSSPKKTDVLITGGAGFLGSAIVDTVLTTRPDWKITILDVRPPRSDLSSKIHKFIQADVTSIEDVQRAFEDYVPDVVLHTAGIVPARAMRYSTKESDWERVKAINYDGTRHVLDAAMAAGCKRFVYTSSCTVVIDDQNHDYYKMDEKTPVGLAHLHYGKSKFLSESYIFSRELKEKGLLACALRPATIIGPGDVAVIGLLHDLIAKGETNFIIGDGDNFYDFMYIDNAVQAHILAADNLLTTQTAAGHAFFVSNDEPVYFWDFLAYVWAQFGHVPKYRIHIPLSIAWFFGLLSEIVTWFTGGASTLDRRSVKDAVRTHYASIAKATRILGYKPTVSLSEGVKRSCDFYKEHLAQQKSGKQT